jgi:hypothetical protein
MSGLDWEKIDEYTERAKTHKGWLVRIFTNEDENYVSVVFVPDPMWAWQI